MANPTKKQSFLHGAALLAMATAAVKLIGAFYKIPLKMIIGDDGYSYYDSAYQIYSLLLLISTAGLPVAMSRMISQASALNNHNQLRKVYRTARIIFLSLGISGSLIMVFGSQWLANNILEQPDAAYAVACLGPCALFMGIISTYRGFFQGHSNMAPTSISQVLEAFIKLLVGLSLAALMAFRYQNIPLAAAGAIFGVTSGCLVSAIFLYCKFRPAYRQLPASQDIPDTFRNTAKGLLAIAVPITIGSAGLQLLVLAEQKLYMSQLMNTLGHSQTEANVLKGIYNFATTIYNMPCAFIVPIVISIIPAVSSALALEDHSTVKETEESAARVAGLISLPCSVGLCILARPIMALLGRYSYSGWKLPLATNLMTVLGICVFLYAIIQFTNALLQAHGHAHIPVVNMLLAGITKLAVVYILVGNENIGILGAPIGSVLSYTAIAALNLLAIRRKVSQKPALLSNLLRPLLPALVMGCAVFLTYVVLLTTLGENGDSTLHTAMLCGIPIGVGVAVYGLCIILFKPLKKEDCLLLPKGDKLAKLLKL